MASPCPRQRLALKQTNAWTREPIRMAGDFDVSGVPGQTTGPRKTRLTLMPGKEDYFWLGSAVSPSNFRAVPILPPPPGPELLLQATPGNTVPPGKWP